MSISALHAPRRQRPCSAATNLVLIITLSLCLLSCRDSEALADHLVLKTGEIVGSSQQALSATAGGREYGGVWGTIDSFEGSLSEMPEGYRGPDYMVTPIIFSPVDRYAPLTSHFMPIPDSPNTMVQYSFPGVAGHELDPPQALSFGTVYLLPDKATRCIEIGKFERSDSAEEASRKAIQALQDWHAGQEAGRD